MVSSSKSSLRAKRIRKCGSFASSSSKQTETECPLEEPKHQPNINYSEEICLIFYNSMLENIVETWETLPEKVHSTSAVLDVNEKDFKELETQDLAKSEVVDVKGSRVSLAKKSSTIENLTQVKDSSKGAVDERPRRKSSKGSKSIDSIRRKTSSDKGSLKKRLSSNVMPNVANNSTNTSTELKYEPSITSVNSTEWCLKTEDENARIIFKNGNVYEGQIHKRAMHGNGKFAWSDGTVYEGEFRDGCLTGKGSMTLPDLSYYKGDFCKGIFHGDGVFCITSSPMMYSGQWKGGKKHGRGWMLYGPGDWYEGEWYEDKRHGMGLRQYKSGARYKGMWKDGLQNGQGSMKYENNDFYKGKWCNGKPHGYGEYTWNAFYNDTLTFPLENLYQGSWSHGVRNGIGTMHFGVEGGAKMAGVWENNMKHGAGVLICGNGKLIEGNPMFLNDKPIHLNSMISLAHTSEKPKEHSNASQTTTCCLADKVKEPLMKDLPKTENCKQCSRRPDSAILKCTHQSRGDMMQKCNPLDIPIHAVAEQINFDHYILDVIFMYGSKIYSQYDTIEFEERSQLSDDNKTIESSKWNILTLASLPSTYVKKRESSNHEAVPNSIQQDLSQLNYFDFAMFQTEQKQMHQVITVHFCKLKEIYNKYATIASPKTVNFKPILVRLFLWQLWRDIGIVSDVFSLVDLDFILDNNPNNGMDSVHDPFEKIYFWQFLLALVAVSWAIHLKLQNPPPAKDGILAVIFLNFINKYLVPNTVYSTARSLFEYRDMLPIQAVYLLYRSLGEPHTAKTFLNATCVRKGTRPPCYLKLVERKPIKLQEGFNAVTVGQNIMFVNDESQKFNTNINADNSKRDPFYQDLYVFRKLGAKKIVQCLTETCPLISSEGVIINMEYPLSFLEFYEVLLLCAKSLVEKEQQIKEAKQSSALPEKSSVVASPRQNLQSKKVSKKNVKDKKRPRTK